MDDEVEPELERLHGDDRAAGEGGEPDAQEEPRIDERWIELAEEPGLWLPGEPKLMIFRGEGFGFVQSGRLAWVHRLRLDEETVAPTADRVEGLLMMRELTEASWWIGELSTPGDLYERLVELGFEPDDPPELVSLTLGEEPAGEPSHEVRRVETLDDLLQLVELECRCFEVAGDEREARRREAEQAWPQLQRNDVLSMQLAFDENGDAVGFGRTVFRPFAALFLGGGTAPEARGKGVYTSIVHARWHDAAARNVPRLVTAAGPGSAPILERLGFEEIGRVRTLRQRVE